MRKLGISFLLSMLMGQLLSAQKFEKHVIHFDTDQSILRPESAATLDSLYTLLSRNDYDTLYLIGHTDSVGNLQYNQDLSARRVKAAMCYLSDKGIPEARLQIKYYGETRPVADNTSEDGRQKNRRVDLFLKKDCGCKHRMIAGH